MANGSKKKSTQTKKGQRQKREARIATAKAKR
jgi:hypothetical protein